MKHNQTHCKSFKVRYHDRWFRISAAVVSAHIIVGYGEPETTFQLFTLPQYYPAMIVSFLIALLMVEMVHYFTGRLDNIVPWERSLLHRAWLQSVYCILLPLIVDCAVIEIYYRANGTNLFAEGHFKYNFLIIVLLVALLNAYYIIHYLYKMKLRRLPLHIKAELKTNGFPSNSYALFFTEGRNWFSVNYAGERTLVILTVEKIIENLSANDYFQINRGCIVGRAAILRMHPGKSRTIRLELHPGIAKDVFVSQRNAPAFKAWYQSHSALNEVNCIKNG